MCIACSGYRISFLQKTFWCCISLTLFMFFSVIFFFLSFTLYITFKCLLLHVYALSCNGILDFLCSRCCVTLLLEMYIIKLGVRTFYKLLAFLLASFCTGSRFVFCIFVRLIPDAIKLLYLLTTTIIAWTSACNIL